MNILRLLKVFPTYFWVDVVVERGGKIDKLGRNIPPTQVLVPAKCLIAPGSTTDARGQTNENPTSPTLYLPHINGRRQFTFQPSDVIIVPDGQWMSGTWSIDGRPGDWPLGWAIRLHQEGPATPITSPGPDGGGE